MSRKITLLSAQSSKSTVTQTLSSSKNCLGQPLGPFPVQKTMKVFPWQAFLTTQTSSSLLENPTQQITSPELLYMLTSDFCPFIFHFKKTLLTTEIFFLFLFLTIMLSRSLTVDLTFIFCFSFYFIFSFSFLFLEQLGLGLISHAVTSVTS